MGRQSGDCDICGAARIAKGLCRTHYDRHRRGLPLEGSPTGGEASCNAKLTANDVREMRALYGHGFTLRGLADKFGVSNVSVYNAVTRRTWKSVN